MGIALRPPCAAEQTWYSADPYPKQSSVVTGTGTTQRAGGAMVAPTPNRTRDAAGCRIPPPITMVTWDWESAIRRSISPRVIRARRATVGSMQVFTLGVSALAFDSIPNCYVDN